MASILRHRIDREFTVLSNETLRDSRLSFRATGLLAYLVSLPDGAEVGSVELASQKQTKRGEGRDAIRTAFNELIQFGYARRYKEQDDNTGYWRTVVEVSDEPAWEPKTEPKTGFQAPDAPAPGNPTVGLLGPLLTEKEPEESNPASPDGDFALFWSKYPLNQAGRRVGKKAASDKWAKLSPTHRAEALVAVDVYAAVVAAGMTFAKDAVRFLASQYWQDWMEPTLAPPSAYSQPGEDQCAECDGRSFVVPDGEDVAIPCPACKGAA